MEQVNKFTYLTSPSQNSGIMIRSGDGLIQAS